MIAPILYHSSCDGYVLALVFALLELNDTFASYRTYFSFIFAGLLLKNHLFSVFKKSLTLLGKLDVTRFVPTPLKLVINRIKLLGGQAFGILKANSSK